MLASCVYADRFMEVPDLPDQAVPLRPAQGVSGADVVNLDREFREWRTSPYMRAVDMARVRQAFNGAQTIAETFPCAVTGCRMRPMWIVARGLHTCFPLCDEHEREISF